jgi:hypothetical protein
MKLPQLPHDKKLHAGICLAIFLITTAMLRIFTDLYGWDILIGVLAGAWAGATKEAYDMLFHNGTPELADFHASLYGVVIGFAGWCGVEIIIIIIKSLI